MVSCLMVTRNRVALARRAVECLANQTWPHRELVIIDDGDEDYAPMLAPYRDRFPIHYHRITPRPGELFLGGLRNLSLDCARGEFVMQWDDDEWYHPDRIRVQMAALDTGLDGCVLGHTLMHLDTPEFIDHPYRSHLKKGTPGTILHRRTDVRYPNLRRAEDSKYLTRLRQKKLRIGVMGPEASHLFIRCFHGRNTWNERHFKRRLYRGFADMLAYLHARFIERNPLSHPAFKLRAAEQVSAQRFLAESRALGLLPSSPDR